MNKSEAASEVIALPKGGGAIKGIGETFQPNLFSGTGNHSVPIAISPGRGGFGPTLSLQYSSGNGNGPFGLGWQLSIPRITRKTEKGLPRYNDTDVFVMSGAEDLVPYLIKVVDPATGNETWEPQDPVHRAPHTVYRYRPRTEGLFARIERWQNDTTHEVHWRATTKDNITSIYGGSAAARLADPDNPDHVYEWLLQETFDATGNHIRYEYAKDNPRLYTHDDPSLELPAIFDRNRNATQLYIRRIYYGNLPTPLLDSHRNAVTYPDGTAIGHDRDGRRYAFEVLFDYGDWPTPTTQPHPDPAPAGQQELFGPDPSMSAQNNPVPVRDDCFSTFRAGFEVRTLRRCHRILMFHHFAELGGPTLVRSTDFTYHKNSETRVSFLTAVTVTGYQKDAAGAYQSASMPPVTFKYAEFRPQEQRYQSIVANGNDMPAQALNDPNFALVDLFGDGLPDVLHSGPAGFRYWRNLGDGRLDRPRLMSQIPAGIALSQPGVGFGDLGGDGQADLLVHSGPLAGFFETTSDGTWRTFKPYDAVPSFDLADPNVRLVDLTGDGLSDALMTGDQHFLWFECLGEHGFAAPKRIARRHDLDTFPDVFFNDPAGRVRLADMTGDGLHDIVLVHNGRIDYWPNLGYGRFGKRITMANAPRLERDFEPKRLFLADLNGTGCADLVYVDFDRVHFWFNQSGNRWSVGQVISGTARVSDVDSIQFADVFGTGTATLLWSYDFGVQRGGNYKALDFCGGVKPYVLTEMSNNMGATTRVSYAPSTKYFVEDQANRSPWVTRLPFPVQVVDKVEVIDHVGKTKLVTTYKYHHGYFDGREREFRGFGRVDQFDTEIFEDFTGISLHDGADLFTNNERSFHVPPVETRTWFHTGIYFDEDSSADVSSPFDYRELTNRFRQEFYQGDEEAQTVDAHDVAIETAGCPTNQNWTDEHLRLVEDVGIVGFGDRGVWTALSNGDGTFQPARFALEGFGVNDGWRVDRHPRFLADVTGDGRADIVGFGDDGVWTALNNGDGTFQPARFALEGFGVNNGWRVDRHPRFLADLTGDGRADIVGFGDDGVWTALNNGDGTFQPARFALEGFGVNNGWRVDRHPRFLADLTGDGRADIVGFGDDGVSIALNNGDGTFAPAQFVLAELGFNWNWRVDQNPRFLVDLTGHGRADIVGFSNDGPWIALSNGDGTFAPLQFVLEFFNPPWGWRADTPRFLADLTGHGRADIIGFRDDGVWTALNNGDGTFQPARFALEGFGVNNGWRVDQHPRFLADLTGDGRADIIGFRDDGVWTALNNGDGTFAPPIFGLRDFGTKSDVETGDTPYEAYRALRGAVLRTEIYARDGGAKAGHPYQVTDNRYRVHQVQPKNGNNHGVYFSSQMESVSYHYERNPSDPRISHALTLQVDDFGTPLKSLAIGYGRRRPDPALPTQADQDKQTQTLITYTENSFTNKIDDPIHDPDNYRTPLPGEARTYELTGFMPADNATRFSIEEWVAHDCAPLDEAVEIGYEETADATTKQKRLIEHVRTRYRKDDLSALLPVGVIESLALPGEDYKLAFTPQILTTVYGGRVTDAMLAGEGGYVHEPAGDSGWWIPSGRVFYSTKVTDSWPEELEFAQQHFFLTHRSRDPFGHTDFLGFDAYDLLVTRTTDPLANTVSAAHDYRVLQPVRMTDPNGNCAEVAFDRLGLVAGTAVMGKTTETKGDSLAGFAPDLTPEQRLKFLADPGGNAADLLGAATSRIVYHLDQYLATQQPIFAATIARESHASDLAGQQHSKLQIAFSYSDGFGREIQKKIQAEPGPLIEAGPVIAPRWVGSGWTIFNNKGKPVRQYEPFFSKHQRADGTFFSDHRFEFGVKVGVSPTLFYDPLERVVATLQPDHTWEKVLFDPWRQETWDVNDTVLIPDPKTDTDVGDFISRLPDGDYLPTWHAQRQQGGTMDPHEQAAAMKAAAHADTPTRAYFDTLGRPFLTVAHNKVVCPDHQLDGTQANFHTRVELDIEGYQRAVRDADQQAGDPLGRIVMRYAYDMLGNRIHQRSMEAGARWMLDDVAGKPIRAWDSRGHTFTTSYDALRRPVGQTVRGTSPDSDPRTLNRDILFDKIEYGEPAPNATPPEETEAQRLNLRTRIYRHCDSAGVVTNARLDANGNPIEAYDFKGNLLHSTRRLVSDYTAIPDWHDNPQFDPHLDDETFEASTRYDALNRPIQSVAPHSTLSRAKRNVIQPVFNEANLLERVDVWLERDTEPAALLNPDTETPSPVGVANIDYNAKGQRLSVDYKNGASSLYKYDERTFRLTQLVTRRNAAAFPGDDPQPPVVGWPGRQVQNLHYTYDPAGNIAHIRDDAQQTIYFRNHRVEPSNDYTYDALYRLIQADGREHLGQLANSERKPPTAPDGFNAFHTRLDQPGNGNAMGTYTERYVYDAVGNFLRMQHRGSDPQHAGWTRAYDYLEASLIEDGGVGTPLKTSNRLSRTTLNPNGANPLPEPYQHDVHGNIVRMPHLGGGAPGPNMHWDYKDQLRQVDLGGGGTAFYVYDASGQRMRKIWEKSPGLAEERIYLGGFEIFREHNGLIGANTATLERETLHVMDDTQRIALVETRTLDTSGGDPAPRQLIRYQIGNHLGSAALELDDGAKIISYEEYSPYGSSMYQAVRSDTETAKRYRYTGKERDEESGLYYHGARYYASWLGRWTACDPNGLADGPCLYAYCSDNPVMSRDPSGTQGEPFGGIGNNPKIGKVWEDAVTETIGKRYGTTNYKDTELAFQKDLAARIKAFGGLGSNKKGPVKFARKTFGPANTRFREKLAKMGISLKGIQVHHGLQTPLAKNPELAIHTSILEFRKGHAAKKGSAHWFAGEVEKARAEGIKNPGPHVVNEAKAAGVTLDVPELGPEARQGEAKKSTQSRKSTGGDDPSSHVSGKAKPPPGPGPGLGPGPQTMPDDVPEELTGARTIDYFGQNDLQEGALFAKDVATGDVFGVVMAVIRCARSDRCIEVITAAPTAGMPATTTMQAGGWRGKLRYPGGHGAVGAGRLEEQ